VRLVEEYNYCTECKRALLYGNEVERGLCYDCFSDLFPPPEEKGIPWKDVKQEEPDFELKHEVAVLSPSKKEDIILRTIKSGYNVSYSDGEYVVSKLYIPKQYVFNHNVRVKDYEKLVEFILANMVITDKSIGIDKVRWMFKEVEKN
jgi:hypothetical protein